jgi:cystathionine beta-lyase
VQDIPAIVAVAKARGIVTVMDNTLGDTAAVPPRSRTASMSAVSACTKYVVGHSDVMLGSATANAALWPRIQSGAWMFGQICGPDDAWLALRGLRDAWRAHETASGRRARRGALAGRTSAGWHRAAPGAAFLPRPCGMGAGLRGDRAGCSASPWQRRTTPRGPNSSDALRLFGIGYSWGGYVSLRASRSIRTIAAARQNGTPPIR